MIKIKSVTRLAAATVLAGAATAGTAYAETGAVQFNGFVDPTEVATCTIAATQVGALQIGDNFSTLTSKATTAGRVKVRANADNYRVTVAGPTAWTTEPVENAGATITAAEAFYTPDVASAGGVTPTEQTGSTPYDLTKNVEMKADIDLVMVQDVDYAPGNYVAEVVVTCE